MNINTIITVSIYCLFFIGLVVGTLIGLKRGLKKSSLRLGSLAIFLLIAGFITYPISKALLTINLSSLNISIGGEMVSTIPEIISKTLFSINGFQEITAEIPSIMTLVEGLPVALMNVIVFTLLIFVMMFLSWIVYIILSHTVLKETKLEKQIKKQKKLEKKKELEKKKKGETENHITPDQKPKAIPLGLPKKHRLWGALIGAIQAFLLMFLILIPITSLTGSFGEVLSNPDLSNQNSLVVYAENESEPLSEYASDIIKNLLGEKFVSYFETFNNAIPTKILTLGGLNNVIFDAFSSVNVNGQSVSIRKDALILTKIYDNYMLIVDQVGINETWSELDFKIVRKTIDLLFQTGLVKAFAEEALPYALDIVFDSGALNLPYSDDIEDGLTKVLSEYKASPSGFVLSLKGDMVVVLNIVESALECGLVDEVISGLDNYDELITAIKNNNYKFLYSFANEVFNSSLFRVATATGLNILLDIGEEAISDENYTANLGSVVYESVDWSLMKTSLFNTLKNVLDIYDIINIYNLDSLFSNPKSILGDIASEDISALIPLVGKEVDLIKDSPLFAGQENNPFKGLILWLGQLSTLKDILDTPEMLTVPNWQNELTSLSGSVLGLKDSGVLNIFVENEEINLNTVFDSLLEEPDAETYLSKILKPLLSSPIAKKAIVYGLNQVNLILKDSTDLSLTEFKKENLAADQNDDILSVAENFLKCFSIFSSDTEFNLETLDVEKIADLLTALQSNAFRKGTSSEVGSANVNLMEKTVTGGGIFSNYYISLVTYVVGNESIINYKTVNWTTFFNSAKALSSNIDDIIGSGSIEDLINLGNEDAEEVLTDLLDSLGLDTTIVEDLSNVQSAVEQLKSGEELSNEVKEEIFETISTAIDNLLNSADEEGNKTVETIINMIQTLTEGDLSEQISTTALSNEQIVSNRLRLLSSQHSNQIDYTGTETDSLHNDMTVFEATLQDLTCGGTYVLQQAIASGTRIDVINIDLSTLISEINEQTTDENIRVIVLSLFNVVD